MRICKFVQLHIQNFKASHLPTTLFIIWKNWIIAKHLIIHYGISLLFSLLMIIYFSIGSWQKNSFERQGNKLSMRPKKSLMQFWLVTLIHYENLSELKWIVSFVIEFLYNQLLDIWIDKIYLKKTPILGTSEETRIEKARARNLRED